MKITDAELIKNGEKELIDAITGDLDWGVIEELFREKHNLGLQDDVEYRQGDIIVYDKKVAYKLQFDVKVTLSVIFDRNGEFLTLSAGQESDIDIDAEENEKEPLGNGTVDLMPGEETAENVTHEKALNEDEGQDKEDVTQMASEIADMISDINES